MSAREHKKIIYSWTTLSCSIRYVYLILTPYLNILHLIKTIHPSFKYPFCLM